ncbi:carboxypeptidase-like regulatory domain-containing protein [Edaphobacter albus]|uniref:carboxypeptidase-like regulatory domain-containing protein n=1 Tax=Edaphobacter sp. 4G125 TaxID=2763071 RepID=UPI001648DD89|nr:carboxypeptidase-like regulatory domain-containing protein [Edaphobacter sp. 4G125]QNI37679.1 carboxypeptidase regulatory-like domain-containing protein [Edaphobacter sp. 4G125]
MYLLHRFLLTLLLSFSVSIWAQIANNTTLVGTITDPSGGVIVGATVSAVNMATNVSYAGTTNREGYYSIPYVSPGTYDVSVEMVGFEKVVNKGTIVQLNLAARTDITLRVGSTNSAVTISATNPPLSTDDAVIGETIDEKKVANLPIIGRHAMDLAATASNIIVGPKTSYTGVPPGTVCLRDLLEVAFPVSRAPRGIKDIE